MNRSKTNRVILLALIFGGCWGIAEATLGHFLHLLSSAVSIPGLAGFVMFPIAFFFLTSAFKACKSVVVIPATAFVTASIKLTSGLLPSVTFFYTINPSIAIVAEGLVVLLLVKAKLFAANKTLIPKVMIASVAWRAIFLLAVFLLPTQKGILNKGVIALFSFLFLESAINTVLITVGNWIRIPIVRVRSLLERAVHPITSAVLVSSAFVFTVLF